MHKFIDNIISFSLKNRFFIFFLTVIAVVAGAVSFMHTPVDAFPDVSNTKVTVITQWPGRSAEEVEKFVTIPVEIAMNPVPNKTDIRSTTLFGLSVVNIVFEDRVDDFTARQQVYNLLNDADLTFPDAHDAKGAAHPVTHGSYIPLMMSADRTLRESAYESLYSSYRQFRNTFAATLGAQNKQLKFFAEARRYESALEAALSANEVPTQVYTNLIETVHNNMDAMYKYVALRKELLDVDELHFSDLYVPIVDDVELTFTYEEACDIILEALRPMGENYLALVRRGLSERWIDVYETPGKRSGAYSAGGYGMHPVILLNFQGKLDDVFTLIHEMGHSIHTYLSCANQPVCYSDYVIFVAEVASTCNEALLTRYLLDHAKNERERAYFLNHFLEQFRATLYRQTMFAEFELKVAELTAQGAGITADALCGIYKELNAQYFGDGIALDENIALEWARIPHFYYRFYVYQYATGFAAAIALSQRILDLGEQGREDYLGFLKGGSSKPPIDLLRGAGVDMLSPEPVEDALKLFDEMVDEMAEACRKLKAEKH